MVLRGIWQAATGLALLGGLVVTSADAMPLAPPPRLSVDTPVTLVRDGCGPGFFRTPFGRCRPAGGVRGPGFGPPRFFGPLGYGPRRCVIRRTYDGPRRICH